MCFVCVCGVCVCVHVSVHLYIIIHEGVHLQVLFVEDLSLSLSLSVSWVNSSGVRRVTRSGPVLYYSVQCTKHVQRLI